MSWADLPQAAGGRGKGGSALPCTLGQHARVCGVLGKGHPPSSLAAHQQLQLGEGTWHHLAAASTSGAAIHPPTKVPLGGSRQGGVGRGRDSY